MRRWGSLFLAVGFGLLAAGCPKGTSEFNQGRKAETLQDYDAALAYYQKALAADAYNANYKIKLNQIRFEAGELHVKPGEPFEVPVTLTRTSELTGNAVLELKLPDELAGRLMAEPLTVPPPQTTAMLRITQAAGAILHGEQELTIRATVLHQGKLPTISETLVVVDFGE